MMGKDGYYYIDDRPMEQRSDEEIRAAFADVPQEVLDQWDRETEEFLKKYNGVIPTSINADKKQS